MLGNKKYCWRHWSPINVESSWGFGNELMVSLCVKFLGRWIFEGLCSSEGIPEPIRVSEKRNMQLKDSYA
jgi:hypothetical protein